jgi:subtilase family serine protease
MKAAYQWPTGSSVGAGQTIAIVTAFDAPTMEADLGVFDSQFGLPACTAANRCLTTLNASGAASPLPTTDGFWAFETHLDVEWAHAIAPGAKIVLIEATDNQFGHLLTALDEAKILANYVSGSFGSTEAAVETAIDHHFYEAPNVSWFFASGDAGSTRVLYPAASPYVVAVGGTMLQLVNGQFAGEVGWSGSGGGCSPYETASPAQAGFTQYKRVGCAGHRAVPDLALDAAPSTGASVYDSQPDENNLIGWFTAGGTSLASPMAAAHAAGTGSLINQNRVYGQVTPGTGLGMFFRDVVQGNNGYPAGPGYDLVTGRGAWVY